MSAESGKAGYTPGPWSVTKHGVVVGGPFHQYVNGEAQSQIAMACALTKSDADDPVVERDANARLIAAAPALVEALKDAVCALQCCGKDYPAEGKAIAALKAAGVVLP